MGGADSPGGGRLCPASHFPRPQEVLARRCAEWDLCTCCVQCEHGARTVCARVLRGRGRCGQVSPVSRPVVCCAQVLCACGLCVHMRGHVSWEHILGRRARGALRPTTVGFSHSAGSGPGATGQHPSSRAPGASLGRCPPDREHERIRHHRPTAAAPGPAPGGCGDKERPSHGTEQMRCHYLIRNGAADDIIHSVARCVSCSPTRARAAWGRAGGRCPRTRRGPHGQGARRRGGRGAMTRVWGLTALDRPPPQVGQQPGRPPAPDRKAPGRTNKNSMMIYF